MTDVETNDGLGIGPDTHLALAVVVCVEPNVLTENILLMNRSDEDSKQVGDVVYQTMQVVYGLNLDKVPAPLRLEPLGLKRHDPGLFCLRILDDLRSDCGLHQQIFIDGMES